MNVVDELVKPVHDVKSNGDEADNYEDHDLTCPFVGEFFRRGGWFPEFRRTLKKDNEIKPIIDTAITILTETLSSGESITIPGFGTFEVRERAATTARNPRTGETVEVAAKRVPAFKPGKALKEAVDK